MSDGNRSKKLVHSRPISHAELMISCLRFLILNQIYHAHLRFKLRMTYLRISFETRHVIGHVATCVGSDLDQYTNTKKKTKFLTPKQNFNSNFHRHILHLSMDAQILRPSNSFSRIFPLSTTKFTSNHFRSKPNRIFMETNSTNVKLMGLQNKKKQIEEEWNNIYSSKYNLSCADFPSYFIFGVATSAYQVEGGSKDGGRGPSIWDSFSHTQGKICDGSNGDVAVDQFHRYKEDIELIAKLGFKAYRFSISWSRIFPDGLGTNINHDGIKYYNNIIDALLERGIEPYITLYHWDLPLNLQESCGGWLDEQIIKYFAIYAETCFASFGNRVKKWITLNEPLQTAVNGYCTGIHAPGRSENSSTEPFLVAHNQLLAHAEAVSIYRNKFKDEQGGEIGLVVDCEWPEPLSENLADIAAATRRLDFQLGWYLDPVFFGDYPESMRERLGDRLPKFSQQDRELLKHSLDFIGLNHYTSRFVGHAANNVEENDFYKLQDAEIIAEWEGGEVIGEKAASSWLYVVPWGIRKVLNYIAERYGNPPVYITENGMDDEDEDTSPLHEMLDDKLRLFYFKAYLAAVHQAILEGANVRGYFAWSLLDNFEWSQGYTKRFGLIYVDFKNGLTRHLKSSAYWFMRFLKGGEVKYGKED